MATSAGMMFPQTHPMPPSTPPSTALSHLTLPSIDHPMSRLSDFSTLIIRGESRQQAANLPPLSVRSEVSSPSCLTQRTDGVMSNQAKFARSIDTTAHRSTALLESLIQEKVTRSFHGLKCMFMANDPTSHQVISREAFLRIIFGLVGYIPSDQVTELLKRFDLDGRPAISFSDFIACFKDSENIQRQWIQTVQQMVPLDTSRHHQVAPVTTGEDGDRCVSVPHCQVLLRQKVRRPLFNFRDHLPESCFAENGRLIAQHLEQFVRNLNIKITEKDHQKLWQRYDVGEIGAVSLADFYNVLGLDEDGRPTAKPLHHSETHSDILLSGTDTTRLFDESEPESSQGDDCDGVTLNSPSERRKKTCNKLRKLEHLEDVIDQLHYKFEESYEAMTQGLRCFDLLENGHIARVDLKKVLDEFGFPIAAIDLEALIARFGLRSCQGQVVYRDIMMRLWASLSSSGLLSGDCLQQQADTIGVQGMAQLERKLITFVHAASVRLMERFRSFDTLHLGVLPPHQFRSAIDHMLRAQMSESQWLKLKKVVPLDDDGLVLYPAFIDTLCSQKPGEWNRRQQNGFDVRKVINVPTPLTVQRIREKCRLAVTVPVEEEEGQEEQEEEIGPRKEKRSEDVMQDETEGRLLPKLYGVLRDLFLNKMSVLYKVFRDIDRKMTCRFSKDQFSNMLTRCRVELSGCELDRLWQSFDTSADNMFHFAKLVSKFAPNPTAVVGTQEVVDVKTNVDTSPLSSCELPERAKLLQQVKSDVVTNWSRLKMMLKQLDGSKLAVVTSVQMKDVFTVLKFHLNSDEANSLLQAYDLNQNNNFHYIEFLKNFAKKRKQVPEATRKTASIESNGETLPDTTRPHDSHAPLQDMLRSVFTCVRVWLTATVILWHEAQPFYFLHNYIMYHQYNHP